MNKLIVAASVALALAGCTVNNPVSNTTEAEAESAYASAAVLANSYLSLPWCAVNTHFTVMQPCKETIYIQKVKAADNVAYTALAQLRAYYKANPGSTVNQLSLINAVINASAAVRAAIPTS